MECLHRCSIASYCSRRACTKHEGHIMSDMSRISCSWREAIAGLEAIAMSMSGWRQLCLPMHQLLHQVGPNTWIVMVVAFQGPRLVHREGENKHGTDIDPCVCVWGINTHIYIYICIYITHVYIYICDSYDHYSYI